MLDGPFDTAPIIDSIIKGMRLDGILGIGGHIRWPGRVVGIRAPVPPFPTWDDAILRDLAQVTIEGPVPRVWRFVFVGQPPSHVVSVHDGR